METARIMRTDPQPERGLVFVEHIRLKCRVCGVIVKPSDLERTLWADDTCPSCNDRLHTVTHKALSADFNRFLNHTGDEIRNKINKLRKELYAAECEWASLIEEAGEFCDRFKWVRSDGLRNMRDFSGLDFREEDEFDFSELKI